MCNSHAGDREGSPGVMDEAPGDTTGASPVTLRLEEHDVSGALARLMALPVVTVCGRADCVYDDLVRQPWSEGT